MATDALSMSLDDLIEKNSKETAQKRASKGATRGGRARGEGRARGVPVEANALKVVVSNRAGGIRKPGGRGGRTRALGGEYQGGRGPAPLPDVPRPAGVIEGDTKWTHDLFQDEDGGESRKLARLRRPAANGFKLLISNLDYNVSEADIKELFEDLGPLKEAAVHYDRSGRSEGTAHVVYGSREHAVQAQKKYHGVSLDGLPMTVELISAAPGNTTLSSGVRVSRPAAALPTSGARSNVAFTRAFQQAAGSMASRSGSSRRVVAAPISGVGGGRERAPRRASGGPRRGGRGGGGGSSRVVVSASDLDKELDTFMADT